MVLSLAKMEKETHIHTYSDIDIFGIAREDLLKVFNKNDVNLLQDQFVEK